MRISDYKKTSEVKKLITVLDENGIEYKKYDFVGKNGKWVLGGDMNYNSPVHEDVTEKALKCGWSTCYTVENGIVGRCARSIPARTLQKIDLCDNDYLDLDRELSMEEVAKYFMFIEPMDCCRHCKGSDGEPVEAAIQIKNKPWNASKFVDRLRKGVSLKKGGYE